MHRNGKWLLIALLLPAICMAPGCGGIEAVLTVNTTADMPDAVPGDGVCGAAGGSVVVENTCSLRAAVSEGTATNGPVQIIVPAGTYTIGPGAVAQGIEIVGGLLTIEGAGAATTTLEGSGGRIFSIDGAGVSLSGFTLRNGSSPPFGAGGAIRVTGGGYVLEIADCVIEDNSASFRGGGLSAEGGSNFSSLMIRDTIIRDNIAGQGGMGGAGGIYTSVNTSLVRVTVSGNSGSQGGGVRLDEADPVAILDSTFTGNGGAFGGGLSAVGASSLLIRDSTFSGNMACLSGDAISANNGAEVTLRSVTVADAPSLPLGVHSCDSFNAERGALATASGASISLENTLLANNAAQDCHGEILSEGFNLVSSTAGCDITATSGDLFDVSAELGPLADNGGPTLTHLPDSGSPALDAASGCGPDDQRGEPRPAEGDGVPPAACDIGSVERQTV